MSTTTFSLAPSALPADANEAHATDAVREVPLSQIVSNPRQPRRHFDEDALLELALSIQERGVLQPLLLRPIAPEQYELIAGERRFRAAQLVGLATVPAIIMTTTEQEQAELALIENLQRDDLNPVETARAFQTLIEQFRLTQRQISERIGKNESVVSHLLHLLELPQDILDSLDRGEIQEGHARALLRISDPPHQKEIWQAVLAERLSVRATERRVRAIQNDAGESETAAFAPGMSREALSSQANPDSVPERTVQEMLARRVERRVAIRRLDGRSGQIEIGFHDDADLIRIGRLLSNAA